MFSYNVSYFKPYEAKVSLMGENGAAKGNGYAFAFDAKAYLCDFNEIGIIIYLDNEEYIRIPFSKDIHTGSLYGLCISDCQNLSEPIQYNFYVDDLIIVDKKAKGYDGVSDFGLFDENKLRSCLYNSIYDWTGDTTPNIPYEKSIFYGLNVRAYTSDKSSKIRHKGTFKGLTEKIDYFNELGITALVLMPAYEFNECEYINKIKTVPSTMTEAVNSAFANILDEPEGRINCWGYTEGYYYSPKSSYSSSKDVMKEFKDMVKLLHQNEIEVIMQFYFPTTVAKQEIINILKYWVIDYHIDGFRINGINIPKDSLVIEPALCSTKLWFDYLTDNDLSSQCKTKSRYTSTNNGNFIYEMRQFLKSDEGLINNFLDYHKRNPQKNAVINFLADYDGFSLADIYSYERKHNEDNGENNSDGNNNNFSWNCGIEGITKKKNISELRKKQIMNALSLLFICRGTPYIFGGDEFGNTRFGNNNAYCQDNEIWNVKWKRTSLSSELLEYTKKLIAFRTENHILSDVSLYSIKPKENGYPDLSFHGLEAWRPDYSFNSRAIGMFYYGPYAGDKKQNSFYIAINMHWNKQILAFPKLKPNTKVSVMLSTNKTAPQVEDGKIYIEGRSIVIYSIAFNSSKEDICCEK